MRDAPPTIVPLGGRRWIARPSAPLTSLVGRTREAADVCALLLRPDTRLVTLTGPGGVGKTRLALQVAADLLGHFPDGVAWAPLAAIRDPDAVPAALARAIGVDDASRLPPLEAIRRSLQEAELLLIVDNVEQVLDAAPQIAALLVACPSLTLLATSRSLLRITGEHAFAVSPLMLPDPARALSSASLLASDAGRLFTERALASSSGFVLNDETAPHVGAICHRLDGLPLAIELAAARAGHLSLPDMLARLSGGLTLLTGGPRDQPSRLQTMRDAIAWSYDLLTPEEQTLFRRLSVFVGGFTLDAAEVVSRETRDVRRENEEHTHDSRLTTLDLIGALVDNSLVRYDPAAQGGGRYLLLGMVREYAAERLAASDEEHATRRAHAVYFRDVAERHTLRPFDRFGPEQVERLDAEAPNLRIALARLEELGDDADFLRMVAALGWFWWVRVEMGEARIWSERANARIAAAPAAIRAAVLFALGLVATFENDNDDARRHFTGMLRIYQDLGDVHGTTRALLMLGWVENKAGRLEQAVVCLEESLRRARSLGQTKAAAPLTGHVLSNLGGTVAELGRTDEAAAQYEEALALHRQANYTYGEMHILANFGSLALRTGEPDRAAVHFTQALLLARSSDHRRIAVWSLEGLARSAGATGQLERAARLFAAADRLREAIGMAESPPTGGEDPGAPARVRAALGEEAFAAAWSAGRLLTLEQVFAEALTGAATAEPPGDAGGIVLTQREREVLSGLAQGLTDRQIAERLFIGERTVESHVARIYAKLGVRTRAAATAAALAAGLVESPSSPV